MKNYKIKIPDGANKILNILYKNGYDGYLVGGCVRDSILGREPEDWDICTDCRPEEMVKLFASFKLVATGLRHGTITVIIGEENYELTTYRFDGDYTDGRHPDRVVFIDELREDLRRRDFTINAMAYNDRLGLIDYYGGLEDISNKSIRSVGHPLERFREDYLRMLRGVRFASQLGYRIEEDTFKAIQELSKYIVNISGERIREELNKILLSRLPSRGLRLLNKSNLLTYIIPELKEAVGFNQHNPHHNRDVFEHSLEVIDNTEDDLVLRLAALFHDIGKPRTFTIGQDGIGHFYGHNVKGKDLTEKIMKRLKYDNKTIEKVSILVKEHMCKYNNISDKGIKRLINRLGKDNIGRLFKLQIADRQASVAGNNIGDILQLKNRVEEILNESQPLSVKDLDINGYDLMELGIKEGREIGLILESLLERVLEDPKINKRDLLREIVVEDLRKKT